MVVLGDSFAEGWGAAYGRRFTEHLREHKHHLDPKHWPVKSGLRAHAINWDMSGKLQLAQMETAYVEPDLAYTLPV